MGIFPSLTAQCAAGSGRNPTFTTRTAHSLVWNPLFLDPPLSHCAIQCHYTQHMQHTMQLYYTQHMYTCRQYKDNLLLCYCIPVWVIPCEWHCTALYTAFINIAKLHALTLCMSFVCDLYNNIEIFNQKSLLKFKTHAVSEDRGSLKPKTQCFVNLCACSVYGGH